MSTRSARLSAVGFLLCIVAAAVPANRLEALLTAHDVRYAIYAPQAERGR